MCEHTDAEMSAVSPSAQTHICRSQPVAWPRQELNLVDPSEYKSCLRPSPQPLTHDQKELFFIFEPQLQCPGITLPAGLGVPEK